MYYGADYYPEQWPEVTWHEDVALMREAGVNLVNVGIFAWGHIQPAEGQFTWEWLDRILDLLHQNGIGVGLATATASPPAWAVEAYPQMLPRDIDGVELAQGSRQHYAPTSPDYRRLASELVTALSTRYANHPAVRLWHVNNEYACHLHRDYSANARHSFRAWLEKKYIDVASLNTAWGTAFWSQTYTSFAQIDVPRRAPYVVNPAQVLDFQRFTSDSFLELFQMERDIIRASGATQPVTTNFMGAFPPADYWKWAREVDVIADDNYPDPNLEESFRDSAFARDLMRSLKPGTPWILMEQSTNDVNWRPTNAPKAPGQMAALSMQAVGHGADGIMFFQWRQSRRGVEKFHSAMVPQVGTDSRVWREVRDLGTDLSRLPKMTPQSGARVAVVFDWESWWAIEAGSLPVRVPYDEIVQRWYNALHRSHYSIDIVHPHSDLTVYAAVIAPCTYLLDDHGADNLSSFVSQGGSLLATSFTDIVDEDDAFRDGGFLTRLRSVMGVRLEEFGALVPPSPSATSKSAGQEETTADSSPRSGEQSAAFGYPGAKGIGEYFAELVHADGAKVLGRFTSGRHVGKPAFTCNDSGTGRGYYLATIPDDATMTELCRWILDEAEVMPEIRHASSWIEVARRGSVRTIINHGSSTERIEIQGSAPGSGCPSSLLLRPFEWTMVHDA